MNIILFDYNRESLLPLTLSRPVAQIRVGILTVKEKWQYFYASSDLSFFTENYLNELYPCIHSIEQDNIWINGSVCPNESLVREINCLKHNEALMHEDILVAANAGKSKVSDILQFSDYKKFVSKSNFDSIKYGWDIFSINGNQIKCDYKLLTHNKNSSLISATNTTICPENIYVSPTAKVECAILNATEGPIYIGDNAEIMEGSIVRGPFALCDSSQLKMGAKVYGPTTIGPYSKAGGELNNVVIFGYSNKAHDGFLGNAVLGEWCNIGADSNNSNLKNNYTQVKMWSYMNNKFENTGLTFCGLIMADHSKCGINTMFNTGTVVGFSANVFGSGFPRNFIPDFSWGGANGFTTYKLNEAIETAKRVYSRRGKEFSDKEAALFKWIFEKTEKSRT